MPRAPKPRRDAAVGAAGAATSAPLVAERAKRWYLRLAWALTTFLGGATLTLLIVLLLREAEANRFTARFHRRAALQVGEFHRDLEHEAKVTYAIASLWDISESFRAPIFERFVGRGFDFDSAAVALCWLERVPSIGREAFEQLVAPNGERYRIVEPGDGGLTVAAARRGEHFPVRYAATKDGAPAPPYGLDFAAFPDRLAAMERARDSGAITAAGHPLLHFFVPLYSGEEPPIDAAERDRRLEGFAVAVVPIVARIESSLRELDLGEFDLRLLMAAPGEPEQEVWGAPRIASIETFDLIEDRHAYQEEWEVAGLHWHAIAVPTLLARVRDGERWSWLAAITGLALTSIGTWAVVRFTRERRRLEREVRQFWELSAELLAVLDPAGYLRRTNPAWETQLGIGEGLIGRPLVDLLHENDRDACREALRKARSGSHSAGFDGRLRTSSGRWRWFQWNLAPDEANRYCHVAARDVTEQRQTFEELERRATLDPLTNVLTRRALFERLGLEIRRSKRYGTPLSLAVLDLDRFKEVNDRHGHTVGDELLRRLGQLLRKALRDSDLAGRFGGDEFVVVMPQTDLDAARKAAARILRSFHEHGAITTADGTVIPLRCSIGVAALGPAITDAMGLVEQADAHLYEAKGRGRAGAE